MKAVEQAAHQGGSWRLAWCLTNLPEPRPSNQLQYGLSTPAEVAASVQFLKDSKTVEELVRRETGTGGETPQSLGGSGGSETPWRSKKGAAKGKEGAPTP
eukprot:5130034-Amphidinium_carterae.1